MENKYRISYKDENNKPQFVEFEGVVTFFVDLKGDDINKVVQFNQYFNKFEDVDETGLQHIYELFNSTDKFTDLAIEVYEESKNDYFTAYKFDKYQSVYCNIESTESMHHTIHAEMFNFLLIFKFII